MSDLKDNPQTDESKPSTAKTKYKTKAELAQEVEMQSLLIDKLEAKFEENEQLKTLTEERGVLNDHLVTKLMDVELQLASSELESKQMTAQNIIKTHMVAGSALALLPVPLFDLAALTGTQVSLLRSLSQHYDVIDFDEQKGKVLLASLISGSIPLITVMGLSSFAKLIPGIGSIGGGISMTVLASSLIYATGQVFAKHFESGGTISDFNSKYWKNYFTEKFEEKKAQMKRQKVVDGEKDNAPA